MPKHLKAPDIIAPDMSFGGLRGAAKAVKRMGRAAEVGAALRDALNKLLVERPDILADALASIGRDTLCPLNDEQVQVVGDCMRETLAQFINNWADHLKQLGEPIVTCPMDIDLLAMWRLATLLNSGSGTVRLRV